MIRIRGLIFDLQVIFLLAMESVSASVLNNSQYFVNCLLDTAQAPCQTSQVPFIDFLYSL